MQKKFSYISNIDGRKWKIQIVNSGKTAPFTEGDNPDTPLVIWDISVVIDELRFHTAKWYAEAQHPPTPVNVLTSLISHMVNGALQFVQANPTVIE